MFALPAKRAVGGPTLNDQVVRFMEALPRVRRIDLVREILHAGADDHTRNNSAFGNHIEHGDFFRYPLGVIVKRQNIAENHQLRLFRSPRQTGRHDVRRRHPAISCLMVFVDADPIEAQLIRQLQFVQIAVV